MGGAAGRWPGNPPDGTQPEHLSAEEVAQLFGDVA
jgi:hypothetical protein